MKDVKLLTIEPLNVKLPLLGREAYLQIKSKEYG